MNVLGQKIDAHQKKDHSLKIALIYLQKVWVKWHPEHWLTKRVVVFLDHDTKELEDVVPCCLVLVDVAVFQYLITRAAHQTVKIRHTILIYHQNHQKRMYSIPGHKSALLGYTDPGTSWAKEIILGVNHAPDAGSIARPVDQLWYGCPHWPEHSLIWFLLVTQENQLIIPCYSWADKSHMKHNKRLALVSRP